MHVSAPTAAGARMTLCRSTCSGSSAGSRAVSSVTLCVGALVSSHASLAPPLAPVSPSSRGRAPAGSRATASAGCSRGCPSVGSRASTSADPRGSASLGCSHARHSSLLTFLSATGSISASGSSSSSEEKLRSLLARGLLETREGGLEEVDEEREEQRSDEVLEVRAWAASYSFCSRSSALMASRSYSLISSSTSACAFAAAAAAVAAAVLGWAVTMWRPGGMPHPLMS